MTSVTCSGRTKTGRCHPRCGACPWRSSEQQTETDGRVGAASGEPGDILCPVGRRIIGAAVECDIELARQIGEIAVIDEQPGHRAGESTSIDQLGRIDAGEGVARDIAHVVEAGLLAGQADLARARRSPRGIFSMVRP